MNAPIIHSEPDSGRNIGYIGTIHATPAEMAVAFGRYRQANGRFIIPMQRIKKLTTAGIKQNKTEMTAFPIEVDYEAAVQPMSIITGKNYNRPIKWTVESQSQNATQYLKQRLKMLRYRDQYKVQLVKGNRPPRRTAAKKKVQAERLAARKRRKN